MRNYSSSAPFKWLRKKLKVDKPSALPWGQWELWDNEFKSTRPVVFFLTETLPDWLEKPAEWIIDPIDNAIYYLRRRFIYRTHLLDTGLRPGRYYDYDRRFLHAAFNGLVEYVECEKAWANIRWGDDEENKYKLPWWAKNWYFRWIPWRCPRAGLDHLQWEMNLENGHDQSQAAVAREIYILYVWWKEIRSKRDIDDDAWVESGMRDFYDRMDAKYGDNRWGILSGKKMMTTAEEQEYDKLGKLNRELEEAWIQEDEDMLIRLIKIRRGLWT